MLYSKNNFLLSVLILCTYVSITTSLGTTLTEDTSFTHCDQTETSSNVSIANDIQNISAHASTTYERSITENENYTILRESYFDHETHNFIYIESIIYPESSETSSSTFEDNTKLSTIDNSFQDHFTDFTREQRQQVSKELEEQELREKQIHHSYAHDAKDSCIIKEQDFPENKRLNLGDHRRFDSEIVLNNVNSLKDLCIAFGNPIIHARFTRIERDYKNKPVKRSWRDKEYNNTYNELKFLKALRSGEVVRLLNSIYDGDLATVESSFNELKNLWDWQREYTFLIPSLTNGTGESGYVAILGIDILATVERDVITRSDYIAAHLDEDSQRIIQEFKKQCSSLQEKNDTKILFNEVKQQAFHRVLKNGRQTNLTDNICLALVEKALLDPINIVLGRIKYAQSLEDAQHELKSLETQLLQYAQERNITSMHELRAQTVEQYGFDLLHASHEMYRVRHDYINTPENQSFLSDHVATIFI